MQNKAIRRNVFPATALLADTTTTSQNERNTWGSGIRFFITVASATTTGGVDSFSLCAVPPGSATPVPLVGFSGVSMLSVAGVYIADFYPSAWLPGAIAAGGKLLGAAGIYLPSTWAVQIVLAVGSVATVTVDAETLP
jgi:hypothetical protein